MIQFQMTKRLLGLGSIGFSLIGIDLEFECFPIRHKEVFCKGGFYWSLWAYRYVIVSFDVFDEVFRSVPLPDSLLVTRVEQIKLAVWNESVALFFYPGEGRAPVTIEVWVLDASFRGVKGSCSWIKKLTIGPLVNIMTPCTFWNNDELLLEAIDGRLFSYNLTSKMLRNLTIQGVERIRRWDFSYVKSLVSVRSGVTNSLNK